MLAIFSLTICVVLALGLIFSYDKIKYPLRYEKEILSASQEFGVKPEIIASIINAESKFKSNAVSNKGAVGLMQILPSTAAWAAKQMTQGNSKITLASVGDEISFEKVMYNPETKEGELLEINTNIRIGTYYFSYLLTKFKNLKIAICAYNAGEGTVKNWLKSEKYSKDGKVLKEIPYKETKNYLEKVLTNINIYEKKFEIN